MDNTLYLRRVLTALFVGVLFILACLILWYAYRVFLLIFAGILFAVFLGRVTGFITRWTGLSRPWGLGLLIAAICLAGAGLLGVFSAQLIQQAASLTDQLTQTTSSILEQVQQTRLGRYLQQQFSEGGGQQAGGPGRLLTFAQQFFGTTFGFVGDIVIIFFLGIYGAVAPDLYRGGLLKLVTPSYRNRASQVLDEVEDTLWGWMVGMFFSMSVIGVGSAIGLALLGVPMAVMLGIITALLTFIPNFGPLLSVIPPALLALQQGPMVVLGVLGLYLGLQLLESYVLTPLVQQREVSLPPALTIAAQVLMGVLAGALGVATAAPLTAASLVLARRLYIEDVLGDVPPPERTD